MFFNYLLRLKQVLVKSVHVNSCLSNVKYTCNRSLTIFWNKYKLVTYKQNTEISHADYNGIQYLSCYFVIVIQLERFGFIAQYVNFNQMHTGEGGVGTWMATSLILDPRLLKTSINVKFLRACPMTDPGCFICYS